MECLIANLAVCFIVRYSFGRHDPVVHHLPANPGCQRLTASDHRLRQQLFFGTILSRLDES